MVGSDKRVIIKNTGLLYIRMFLTMAISLYTSRIILQVLGVVDFGIYNVVCGVVTMFSFLNGVMSVGTSRFLIYELGRKNYERLKKIFSITLTIHIGIALSIFVLAETIGLWFVVNKLVIPADRQNAVFWTYQFAIFASMIQLVQVPLNASIIAHEKMNIYAYVSIIDVSLRLGAVFLLMCLSFDKLIMYSLFIFLIAVIIAVIYWIYCRRRYAECCLYWEKDKSIYKELLYFSGWGLIGSFSSVVQGQGLNILLNLFFGPIVNAARGFAFQVQTALSMFGNNFMIAVQPRITKLYAEGKCAEMMKLVFASSKYGYFLMLFVTLPLLFETIFVLKLWLKDVPEYTVVFCRYALFTNLILILKHPFVIAYNASGNIRKGNIVGGIILISALPISYIFFRVGASPVAVCVITLIVVFISLWSDLFIMRKQLQFSVNRYALEVLVKCMIVTFPALLIPWVVRPYLGTGWIGFISICFLCVCVTGMSIFYLGLEKELRKKVIRKLIFKWNGYCSTK